MIHRVSETTFVKAIEQVTEMTVETDEERPNLRMVSYFKYDRRFAQSVMVNGYITYLVDSQAYERIMQLQQQEQQQEESHENNLYAGEQ